MQALIYTRISDDRFGQMAGVTRQEEDCRGLVILRGWSLLEVIIDNDTSAAGKVKRPGFERLLSEVEAGSVEAAVAWSLDRLTRNRPDTVRLIETCQRHGVTIALVRGSDLDMSTPAGRLTADLLAAVARSEIETKSDRQHRAAIQAAEQGRYSGGRRAFGYEPDGMTIRETEAEAVRAAYRTLLDGGSLRSIAATWNLQGLRPPQSAPLWVGSVVSRCLRKPRYAGLRSHLKEIVGDAQWPALVDRETWYAAQAVMADPDRTPARGHQRLLTGVALCGVCDGPVHAGGGAAGRGVYRCINGSHVIRRRDPVDEYVSAVVIERLSRSDAADLFQPVNTGPSLSDLLAELDQLRKRRDGLAEAFADGALSQSQLRTGTARVNTLLAEVEQRMSRLAGFGTAVRQLVTAHHVAEAWESLPRLAQRQVIDQLVTIHLDPPGRGVRRLDPATVRIGWR